MKTGRKLTYDSKRLDELISYVKEAKGSFGQVADLAEIARDNFYYWLRSGDEDNKNDIGSEVAQFSSKLRKEQALVVTALAKDAFGDEKKTRFIIWWLGKICKEDFGEESEELKYFKNLLMNEIVPMWMKGAQNGSEAKKELDQGSD